MRALTRRARPAGLHPHDDRPPSLQSPRRPGAMRDEPIEQQHVARPHRYNTPFTVRYRLLENPEVAVLVRFVTARRRPVAWNDLEGTAVLGDVGQRNPARHTYRGAAGRGLRPRDVLVPWADRRGEGRYRRARTNDVAGGDVRSEHCAKSVRQYGMGGDGHQARIPLC